MPELKRHAWVTRRGESPLEPMLGRATPITVSVDDVKTSVKTVRRVQSFILVKKMNQWRDNLSTLFRRAGATDSAAVSGPATQRQSAAFDGILEGGSARRKRTHSACSCTSSDGFASWLRSGRAHHVRCRCATTSIERDDDEQAEPTTAAVDDDDYDGTTLMTSSNLKRNLSGASVTSSSGSGAMSSPPAATSSSSCGRSVDHAATANNGIGSRMLAGMAAAVTSNRSPLAPLVNGIGGVGVAVGRALVEKGPGGGVCVQPPTTRRRLFSGLSRLNSVELLEAHDEDDETFDHEQQRDENAGGRAGRANGAVSRKARSSETLAPISSGVTS